jgi:hypothetical protein
MTLQEFQTKVQELQDTVTIGQDPEKRRSFYELFDDLYLFLETNVWEKENLIEHGEPNPQAHFQSVAEGYYRLGFFEVTFYYYSKLTYDLWYQKVLEYQEKHSERLHKGTQVHQIGIILDLLSDKALAWDYYIAGLIEDVVTGRTMESSQAFRMLRVLGMPRAELEVLDSKIKQSGIIFDPLGYISQLRRESSLSTYAENQSVDYNKLKQAEVLWNKVLKEKEEKQNGK